MIGADGEELVDEKICFPVVSLDTSYAPNKIKTAFEGALKSRNTDSALCLIGLRRTLEMVCNEQGATKKTLVGKIEVSTHELGSIIEFVESVIDYMCR